MVGVGLIDTAAGMPAPAAGPCRGCDLGLSTDARSCAACAAARRRAYAHTERGRRMVRDSQRRYRAKRRGGFADQPGLVRLLGNELRLRCRWVERTGQRTRPSRDAILPRGLPVARRPAAAA